MNFKSMKLMFFLAILGPIISEDVFGLCSATTFPACVAANTTANITFKGTTKCLTITNQSTNNVLVPNGCNPNDPNCSSSVDSTGVITQYNDFKAAVDNGQVPNVSEVGCAPTSPPTSGCTDPNTNIVYAVGASWTDGANVQVQCDGPGWKADPSGDKNSGGYQCTYNAPMTMCKCTNSGKAAYTSWVPSGTCTGASLGICETKVWLTVANPLCAVVPGTTSWIGTYGGSYSCTSTGLVVVSAPTNFSNCTQHFDVSTMTSAGYPIDGTPWTGGGADNHPKANNAYLCKHNFSTFQGHPSNGSYMTPWGGVYNSGGGAGGILPNSADTKCTSCSMRLTSVLCEYDY